MFLLVVSRVPTCVMSFLVRVVMFSMRLDRSVRLAALLTGVGGILTGTSVSPVVPLNSVEVDSTSFGVT